MFYLPGRSRASRASPAICPSMEEAPEPSTLPPTSSLTRSSLLIPDLIAGVGRDGERTRLHHGGGEGKAEGEAMYRALGINNHSISNCVDRCTLRLARPHARSSVVPPRPGSSTAHPNPMPPAARQNFPAQRRVSSILFHTLLSFRFRHRFIPPSFCCRQEYPLFESKPKTGRKGQMMAMMAMSRRIQ